MGICSKDRELVQIVDAALAEAARKSGPWLACRPGCTQCCLGPFPITQLDALRLRQGLAELEQHDPERAARVRERACDAVARISPIFPGDAVSGVLANPEETSDPFWEISDDDPCPALDPATGLCDLYAARPLPCRTFGPPVRCSSGALGICELCFKGATDAEIAACEVEIDPDGLEAALLEEIEVTGETIVAYALSRA